MKLNTVTTALVAVAAVSAIVVSSCTSSPPPPVPHSTVPSPAPTIHHLQRPAFQARSSGIKPRATGTCTASSLNGSCPTSGSYDDNNRPTNIEIQDVGANSGTTANLTTNGFPASVAGPVFSSNVSAVPLGYGGIQVYPSIQEQFYGWDGKDWNCQAAPSGCGQVNTPMSALSALKVNFSETSPQDQASQYEWATDVWSNYADDTMFWTDTSSARCVPGGYGTQVIGQAVLDGQNWTVTRYGGPGSELIFVLNGPGGLQSNGDPVSCARETSGTIDVEAGFQWLVANGIVASPASFYMVNSGWEVTSADNTTFTQNSYSITATLGTPPPSPSPSASQSNSPAPTTPAPTTSKPPSPTPTPTSTVTRLYGCLENNQPKELFNVSTSPVTCPAGSTMESF